MASPDAGQERKTGKSFIVLLLKVQWGEHSTPRRVTRGSTSVGQEAEGGGTGDKHRYCSFHRKEGRQGRVSSVGMAD